MKKIRQFFAKLYNPLDIVAIVAIAVLCACLRAPLYSPAAIIALWIFCRLKLVRWLGEKFGEENARTALWIAAAAFVFFLLAFWNFKTAPFEDVFFDTDQMWHENIMNLANGRHPLYFLWRRAYSIFEPLVGARYFSVAIAAITTGMFYLTASVLNDNRRFNKWLAAAFALSAPMIIHAAMTMDTYLFSAFSIMLGLLYFSCAMKSKTHNSLAIAAIGLLMFGTTSTNIVPFGFFYLTLLFVLPASFGRKIRYAAATGALFFAGLFALNAAAIPSVLQSAAVNSQYSHMVSIGFFKYAKEFFGTIFMSYTPFHFMQQHNFHPFSIDWIIGLTAFAPLIMFRRIRTKQFLGACYASLMFYFVVFMFFGWSLALPSPLFGPFIFIIFAHIPQIFGRAENLAAVLVAMLAPANLAGSCYVRKVDRIVRGELGDAEIISREIARKKDKTPGWNDARLGAAVEYHLNARPRAKIRESLGECLCERKWK